LADGKQEIGMTMMDMAAHGQHPLREFF